MDTITGMILGINHIVFESFSFVCLAPLLE